ncbi:MAG: YcxB family protein [Chloroflexi bacterium]|nr:YcxB family protein [Chloroflexota bacterium]
MAVEIDITRREFFKYQIYTLYQTRTFWGACFLILGIVISTAVYKSEPIVHVENIYFGILSFISAVWVSFLASFLAMLSLLIIVLGILFLGSFAVRKKLELAGRFELEANNDGLIFNNSINESLVKWSGINSISQTKNYILVKVKSGSTHFLPKNCFVNGKFDNFGEFLNERWQMYQINEA